ncbi:helix-turn-helix transcriptional regulator [Corynebacterium sanguinis]|uniref:PadR family transcriptional regulator n=2 Tax=Corynebacterium sanguinis TaxID=2594913 RepID=A0A6C1TWT6_9CORY|nr:MULTISPECIES: PadR family transcriptional regulator [Corynebacterium]MBA4505388.1 PadR family transcriptional regulator [Corynebacterium sanguinis]MCT1413628.1 PadR family transcriptional regulator [Corynebacterium sanguinis]MCT1425412.1 PadR family transcriptional regulator [Corynebacterium sanguinis]MCT1463546.1 PadR family transcriptional regulator [Corynebacterium sanguinis]MCT1499858.1 PadR family transcriptional regulator [Corynebacterium sanguinis]
MQHLILGLLLTGPLSLYDVHKRFASGLAHFYSASFGSIERALKRLVDDGLAAVEPDPGNARGRKLYSITQSGRASWSEWMHSPTPSGSDLEQSVLAKVFLLGRIADPAERSEILRLIREEAEASESALLDMAESIDAQAKTLDAGGAEFFAYHRATLEYGLASHRTMIEWLRRLEEAEVA